MKTLDRDPSTYISRVPSAAVRPVSKEDIAELHRRCGIYTKPEVVRRILDAVGWRDAIDLSQLRLLEPAAGDGVFVVEAARRLVASCRRHGTEPTVRALANCIRAFELHRGEARRARSQVFEVLRELSVHHRTATTLAKTWIVNRDFLLSELPASGFTHAVGNPPYVRWSKIPGNLKTAYSRKLPREMIGGDLFLPFLDRTLEQLRLGGRCGLLCSDRWRFMAFAEAFRTKWLPQLDIASEDSLLAIDAFVEDVDAYPTILIAKRRASAKNAVSKPMVRSGKTLAESGCVVKVGPALGHTPAFVLHAEEHDVESELLHPWIDASEISEGTLAWRGRRVIAMYGNDGKLIEPRQFPMLMDRLDRFKKQLKQRSIVRNGAPWFRPIDRVSAKDWTRPKLLIPELAKVPRIAIDRSGMIPSHGVYAIFAARDEIGDLYERLRDGQLARALDGLAPKIKGGYVRCYRRFLEKIRFGD